MLVVGIGEPVEVRQQIHGYVSPQFSSQVIGGLRAAFILFAKFPPGICGIEEEEASIEGVQHAVVCTHIDDLAPVPVFEPELPVGTVSIEQVVVF